MRRLLSASFRNRLFAALLAAPVLAFPAPFFSATGCTSFCAAGPDRPAPAFGHPPPRAISRFFPLLSLPIPPFRGYAFPAFCKCVTKHP